MCENHEEDGRGGEEDRPRVCVCCCSTIGSDCSLASLAASVPDSQ